MCVLLRIGPLHDCNVGSKVGESMRTLLVSKVDESLFCGVLQSGEFVGGLQAVDSFPSEYLSAKHLNRSFLRPKCESV